MPLSSESPIAERLKNYATLLHSCTNLAEAKRLIGEGEDPNAYNGCGQVPLHTLMRSRNPKAKAVILYLLSLDIVDPNAAELDGTTIAHLCEWGPIMSALVNRADFDPNKINQLMVILH